MGDKQQSAYLFSSFSSQVPDFLKEAKSDSLLVQAWPCCHLRHFAIKGAGMWMQPRALWPETS